MKNHIESIRSQANRNKETLSKIFNGIWSVIADRETELRRKISEVILVQEETIDIKRGQLEKQVKQISEFKRRIKYVLEDSNT